jgi:hypothetical protein
MPEVKTNGTVKNDLENENPEVLASAIVEVAASAKKLLNSRLTEEAIIVLLRHSTGFSKKVIKEVLHSAAELDKFVKKSTK